MNGLLRILWIFAILSGLLALASFAGSGTGPFGQSFLAHPIWTYVLLVVGGAVILAFTPPRKQPEEAIP